MSINLYQTGVSGLLAAQQQLAVTGHNISNVNTEGYSRQRAEQAASTGIFTSGNFIGSGTFVNDVARVYDEYSYREQLLSQSNLGHSDSLNIDLNQLNGIISSSGDAIVGSIEQFYQAINGIADNPSDLGLRNIALSQAEGLANDFNRLNTNFDQLEKSTNGEIEQITSEISQISYEIAKINDQILRDNNLGVRGQPNDLLDTRDQLVAQLSKYTTVNTIEDQHGVITVMIGSGATLVAGITPLTVSVQAGVSDPLKTELRLNSPNGSVALNASNLGGSLAAKMEFRDEHLLQARNEINQLALAVSGTLNQVQSQGLDLDGLQGRNLFTDINSTTLQASRVLAYSSNTGALEANVSISDVTLIPTNEFEIKFDGSNYILTDQVDGSTTDLGAAGAGTYTTAFGFEFNEISGTPNANDTFTIRPSENSASLIQVTLTDGKGIAASSAVEASANSNNVSDGAVNVINVSDPEIARSFTQGTNSQLTVDVYESAPGIFDYRVYDAANPPPAVAVITSGSFNSGTSAIIDLPPTPAAPAFQIEILGSPVGQGEFAREKFNISDVFGQGNSSNANVIAATQEQKNVAGNRQTFTQALAITTADIGSNASSIQLVADTAEALFTQAYNRNQSTSGVNLDEEAANMIKFQQAYQASSRIISVANTLFDTILAAV